MSLSIKSLLHRSGGLLTQRNFSLLMGGQIVSQIGENLNRVALFWFVYLFSHRISDMVVVGVLQTLPPLLFGGLNGVLLDRHSKKWIMIGVDITRGLLVFLIPLLYSRHLLSLPILYFLVFLISTMSGIFGPALYSAVPLIVERDRLLSANALMQTTGQIGLLVGPVVGGLLAVLWSPSGEMLINGVTFLASAFFLLFMKIEEPRFHTDSLRKKGILSELREGVLFVFDPRKKLAAPFFFMVLYGLVTGPINILLLILSRHILNRGADGFGDLIAAFGVGMLVSSLLLTFHPPKNIVSAVMGGYGIAGILFLTIGEVSSFPIDLVLFGFWGAAVSIVNPLSQTLIQHITPPRLLARVLTVMSMGFLLGIISGMVTFPQLTRLIGIPDVFELMGGILLVPLFLRLLKKALLTGEEKIFNTLPDIDPQ
jgi:MFS family permease